MTDRDDMFLRLAAIQRLARPREEPDFIVVLNEGDLVIFSGDLDDAIERLIAARNSLEEERR